MKAKVALIILIAMDMILSTQIKEKPFTGYHFLHGGLCYILGSTIWGELNRARKK
jgi:hypothetical protein